MSPSGPSALPASSAATRPLFDLRPGARVSVSVTGSSIALLAAVFAALWLVAEVTDEGVWDLVGSNAVFAASGAIAVILAFAGLLVAVISIERRAPAIVGVEPWASMVTATLCVFFLTSTVIGALYDHRSANSVVLNVLVCLATLVFACRLFYNWSNMKEQRKAAAITVQTVSKTVRSRLRDRVNDERHARRRFVVVLLVMSAMLGLVGPAIWLWTHHASVIDNVPFYLTIAFFVSLGAASTLWGSFVSAAEYFASPDGTFPKIRRWLWVGYYSLPALIVCAIISTAETVRSLALPFAAAWMTSVVVAHITHPRPTNSTAAQASSAWKWLPGQALVDAVYERAVVRKTGAKAELRTLRN